MRRGGVFWGTILIVVGVLFLLNSTGVLRVNVWSLFWSLLLIAAGLSLLWGVLFGRPIPPVARASVPLSGAEEGRVRLRHGAGELAVSSGAPADQLLEGVFHGGVDYRTYRQGQVLAVDLRPAKGFYGWPFPFIWLPGRGLDWTVRLSPLVPLRLVLDTGASRSRLDLSGLRVVDLDMSTGASATDVILPAGAGQTRARIKSGVAAMNVRVPEGVAAHIEVQSGLAGITVAGRFPRSGGVYQSPDYGSAANRVDLRIVAGVGAVTVE